MARVPPDVPEAEAAFGHRLSPEQIGLLAKRLAKAIDPAEAALLRERLTRGFYGL